MTRKHFEAIARDIREANKEYMRKDVQHELIDILALRLADTLAIFNTHFDRQRFIEACQPRP